jgi:EpsI family protein
MGYYGSQRQGDTIHSPQNCLPGAGWEPVSEGRLTLPNVDGAGREVTINRYVIQKGLDQTVVLYWYHGRGRVVANEYLSRALLIRDALVTNRTNGSLVRVIVPVLRKDAGNLAPAESLAEEFVRAIFPSLDSYLP